VIAGAVGSHVVVPVPVYHHIAVEKPLASGGSVLALGLLALVSGFLMGRSASGWPHGR
jgi:hypothetical protein